MHKVRLSENARNFIWREAKYLRDRNQAAAEKFLDRLRDAWLNLAQFPKMGRQKDALPVEGSMCLIVGDYVIDYDLDGEVVSITSIRHGHQQDPDLAKDDDFDFEDDSSPTSKLKS